MKVLGITGGVGSGKSQVLEHLQKEFGATVCQLDQVAKELQKKGQPCYDQIVEAFGVGILEEQGELDRGKLAQVVFQNPEKLQKLNEIVHPEVKHWVQQDIAQKKNSGCPLYVIEAALMPGAGYDQICQEMWYIYAAEAVRRQRLKQSRGYSEEKITSMIQAQPTEEAFRQISQVVIENSGSFEDTKKQIGELLP